MQVHKLNIPPHLTMTSEIKHEEDRYIVHFSLRFKQACLTSVFLPFLALVICFCTAYTFQYSDIQETHCQVFNVIPSISAITGISPQTYLWRISIAFHILPRLIISAVHRAYHLGLINVAQPEIQLKAQFWLNAAFRLNAIETGALCGVTYISNRENYGFVAFPANYIMIPDELLDIRKLHMHYN